MEFVLFLITGLIFGSFLNVLIYRLKNGHHLGGRSFCPKCKITLKWTDLIPILSFVYLYGHCRHCKEKISWQYPIVEALSGLLWIGIFYKNFGGNFSVISGSIFGGQFPIFNFQFLNTGYEIFIFSLLLVIAVYDFWWQIIPDKVVYPAITIIFIYNIVNAFKLGNYGMFIITIITASISFLFFFLIYFFSKGYAMGFGDVKLAFLIGLFLKPFSTFVAFNLAFIIGAICGIILLVVRRKTLKSQIPFGPFMILGTAIAFFLSNFINNFFIF